MLPRGTYTCHLNAHPSTWLHVQKQTKHQFIQVFSLSCLPLSTFLTLFCFHFCLLWTTFFIYFCFHSLCSFSVHFSFTPYAHSFCFPCGTFLVHLCFHSCARLGMQFLIHFVHSFLYFPRIYISDSLTVFHS